MTAWSTSPVTPLETAVFLDLNSFSFEHFTNGATIHFRELFRRLMALGVRCAIVTAVCANGARLVRAGLPAHERHWILLQGIPVLELPIDGSIEDVPDAYVGAIESAVSLLAPDLILVNTPPDRLEEAEVRLFEWLARRRERVLCFVPDAAFPAGHEAPGRFERFRGALARLALVAPSRFIAGQIQMRLGLSADCFPNLFDVRRIVAASRAGESERLITFVNPHPMKGLAVVAALAEARPDLGFQFVETWPYPPHFAPRTPNVELVPFNPDMRYVWSRASVLLVPSLCFEAFGRVVVEAQLNGIPVVHHDIGGLGEAAGGAAIAVRAPPFRGPAAFPEVGPQDLADTVDRWSAAIDGVLAEERDRDAIRAAACRYLEASERHFSQWVETVRTPGRGSSVLVVAPHCDDAAFSLGGLLTRAGERCIITTLFGRSGYTARGGLGGDADVVSTLRIAEERAFADAVGALLEVHHLPEAALRHPGGFEDIFKPPSELPTPWIGECSQLTSAVDAALDRDLQRHKPAVLLLPLGLGNHRDHRLARDAGLIVAKRRGVPVAFYEDLPYAAELDDAVICRHAREFAGAEAFWALVEGAIETKINLCGLYASQVDAGALSAIRSRADLLGGAERLWVCCPKAALSLGFAA
jgi:LmbE family N-acetylglucosaminyl deacetylase/glycosyltransferase involved in cell wall biosynthesis